MKSYKLPRDILFYGLDTHIVNRIINKVDFSNWKKCSPDLASLVESNSALKGIHKGERCFILANGPSIKGVDLSRIKDEILFGMNLCCESFYKSGINLNYYLALDGVFFQGYLEDRMDMVRNLKYLEKMSGVKGFFPIECRDFIRGYRFDQNVDIHYLGPVRLSMEKLITKEDNACDIARFRYLSYSIAIDAVMMAIYMGMKEIYLLGCDASVIKSRIDVFMGNAPENVHFYDGDEKGFEAQIRKKGIVTELRTEYNCFNNWNYINLYCMKHGIKLVNLSSTTLLDFIPRRTYDEQLKKLGIQ